MHLVKQFMENPKDIRLTLIKAEQETDLSIPLAAVGISAGFPSPADDFIELSLDLNKELIRNPPCTFFARVSGVSMVNDGIDDGDLLVVDKSVTPYNNCLAVCFIDGEFTLKRFRKEDKEGWLIPANENYAPIRVTEDNDFRIWGVVLYVIKKM